MASQPLSAPLPRLAALGVFWGTIERITVQGTSFVVVLVLARILGPADYGLVTLAATIALLGQMLLGETFSQALIQHKDLDERHAASLFWVLLAGGIASALALAVAAPVFAAIFAEPRLTEVVRALSPLLVLSGLQAVPSALFKRALDFRSLASASALGSIIAGLVGIGLAVSGFGIDSLIANLVIQNAVVTAAILRKSPFRPSMRFSQAHVRDLWKLGQFNFLLRISAFSANQAPRILVGYLFGAPALGAFSLGLRIVEMLYQLLTVPVANVTISLIARVREDRAALERAVLSLTEFAAMAAMPVFAALAAIAPIAVTAVFGSKWAGSETIVRLFALFGIVGSCGLVWNAIVTGLGRPDITLATSTSAALVNLTVLLISSPFGISAAAAAFVVRGYATLPFLPIVIARLTGIPAAAQFKVYGPIVAASLGMALAIEAMIASFSGLLLPLALTAVALAGGVAVYVSILYVLARPRIREGLAFMASLKRPKGEP